MDAVPFADHHRYTLADVAALQRNLASGANVVCTLKDAVKLGGLWPREGQSLWYVSLRVEFEGGVEAVNAVLDAVPRIRPSPDR